MGGLYDLLILLADPNSRLSGFDIDPLDPADLDPGDEDMRWNAVVMVDDKDQEGTGLGGYGTTKEKAIDTLIFVLNEEGLLG